MNNSQIHCPNCNHAFDIEEVLSNDIEKKYKEKFQADLNKQTAEIKAREEESRKKLELEKIELQKKEEQFQEAKKRENELFLERINKEKKILEEKFKLEANQEFEAKLKSQEEELERKNAKLKDLQQKELAFEQMQKSLKEREESFELELQKKLSLKEDEIKLQAQKMADEKANLRLMEMERSLKLKEEEKDLEIQKAIFAATNKVKSEERELNELRIKEMHKQMEDQKKLIEEMKRKSEQGSMQLQGEVQELALEELLRSSFPFDSVDAVPKGITGADCVLTVRNKMGTDCGKIVFESKRTKAFAGDWIEKLKNDTRSIQGDMAILVTEVLPKEMDQFGMYEGIYICTFREVRSLVMLVRENLIQLHLAMKSQENRGDKMQLLYNYLTGSEFRMQVEAIVEGFSAMKEQLDKEKKAFTRIWAEREKQIDKVITSTVQMYGSMKGIAGGAIQDIQALEFGSDLLE